MNCVSGGASQNLLIQQNEVVLSIEYFMPGSLHACSYVDEWYFGVKLHFSKNCDVNIKFFHQNGPSAQFFRPSLEETCWISIHNIIAKVDPPLCGSTGRFYCLDFDEMNCIKKLM